MSIDLHTRLADLANEVRPVDLRDGVLAGSRRVRTRNRVVASVASAAAVAVLVTGVVGLGQAGSTPVPLAPVPAPPVASLPGVPDLDGRPLTIPTVPNAGGCDGTATLRAGRYTFPGGTDHEAAELVLRKVVRVDVDRDGRPDAVAFLRCTSPATAWYRVLVYADPDSTTPRLVTAVLQAPQRILGYVPDPTLVTGTPEGITDVAADPDGTVRVEVSDVADWYDAGTGWLGRQQPRYVEIDLAGPPPGPDARIVVRLVPGGGGGGDGRDTVSFPIERVP
jgi:hypothetical protein